MDESPCERLNREGRKIRQSSDAWLGRFGFEPRSMYFDRAGLPLELGDFALLFENIDYRIVRRTNIRRPGFPPMHVSTVWLGIDHNHLMQGPPLIFETMVFGGPMDLEQDRYSTEEQARLGHRFMCQRVFEISLRRLLRWEVFERGLKDDDVRRYVLFRDRNAKMPSLWAA